MRSNSHLKQEAILLRQKGKSYSEILKALSIKSKGTLSHWFKNITLSEESRLLLDKNNKLSHDRGLFKANAIRKERIETENKSAFLAGKNSIDTLSKRDLLLIGTSLYWAEGTKSERSILSLTFSNSDPLMITVYMRFLREVLEISEGKIRAGIHIYPTIIPDDARKFWSEITKLPIDRFYIITQVSRASQNKRPFNILPYGTAVIKVNSRTQFHKVKGMIDGIVQKLSE
jgi:hypothetical protein